MAELNETLREMGERLASIETEIRLMREQGSPQCVLHDEKISTLIGRMEKVESAQGKQNAIYITMSAIGIGIGFAIKYLFVGAKA